jgi:hypothetical protein
MELPSFQAGRTALIVATLHSAGEVPRHGASGYQSLYRKLAVPNRKKAKQSER